MSKLLSQSNFLILIVLIFKWIHNSLLTDMTQYVQNEFGENTSHSVTKIFMF